MCINFGVKKTLVYGEQEIMFKIRLKLKKFRLFFEIRLLCNY